MTYQANTKSLGFRELSPAELCAVSGGGDDDGNVIVVTGRRETRSIGLTTESLASLGIFGFGTDGYFGLGEGNHHGGGGTVNEIIVTGQSYDPNLDWCGTGWNGPWVPDSIFGIDVSFACFIHDTNYSAGSDMDRFAADLQFYVDVYTTLIGGGMNAANAAAWAGTYFGAVRTGGEDAYQGSGSRN